MPGKPLQAWSARMPGWRITPAAAAALNAVAAMAAMPLVALAQTSSAELTPLRLSSGTLRPTFAAAATD